jgi:hypothetical protein
MAGVPSSTTLVGHEGILRKSRKSSLEGHEHGYGQFAPQKAGFLPDFDYYNVGLLAPSSRLNGLFIAKGKDLVCRPDFDAEVFAKDFPVLSQGLARQVGGPKVRLANIPIQR